MGKSIVTICNKKKNKMVYHRKVWVVKEMSWKRDIFFSNFELEMLIEIKGEKDVVRNYWANIGNAKLSTV